MAGNVETWLLFRCACWSAVSVMSVVVVVISAGVGVYVVEPLILGSSTDEFRDTEATDDVAVV